MTPHATGPDRRFQFALLFTAALAAWLPAMASGTQGSGAGGDPYALGQRLYLKRIACPECPAPGGAVNAEEARTLLERVQRDEFALKPREQRAVIAYLKRRWRLH